MKKYRFKGILQNEGWIENATISVDDAGLISSISSESQNVEQVAGYALPGFQNAHSHAFQYAMAGIAERHQAGKEADDFWSWREAMYQLALTMSPDDLEAVATMLYAEMARHGYTQVAEFHYLHHDIDGKPYANLAEHGERLVSAAQKAGIKITLVPMFYQRGGFGLDPQPRQRRFISKTIEDYDKLLTASKQATSHYSGANLGYGVHSLRAATPDDFVRLLEEKRTIPFHIHIAEQLKEIEDSISYLKKRPVQWLLDNVNIDDNCHLVHATHLIEEEIKGIANSGANVVLCPSTEGNLGDGIFPLKQFQSLGGKWSIGTDSHIGLNPLEELRILDYGQRLTSHNRNTFTDKNENDSGTYAIKQSQITGRKAMGNTNIKYFAVGQPFDAVVYDANTALLAACSIDNLLSTIVYASDSTWVLGTMVDGKWVVKDQNHSQKEKITLKFKETIQKLKVR
ncbi:MAG TPA: formimidoylglutamate deiminase [Fulvivirga sp.]|nr:formimidoylglutamate deiminase [Fulvivirga sp.]